MTTPKVWPTNKTPVKEEIERMYKCAYYVDRSFFRPADLVDFGLDFYSLKELGQVNMKKDLGKIRPHVLELWERMSKAQRTIFLYSYLVQGCNHVSAILKDLEIVLEGSMKAEQYMVETLIQSLNRKFPEELQKKLDEGFGKEWA